MTSNGSSRGFHGHPAWGLNGYARWLASSVFSFETLFVLFLFAGRFKADPRFAAIPVDLTALLLVLSMATGAVVLAGRRFFVSGPALRQWLVALAFFSWVLASWLWSQGGDYSTQKAGLAFVMNLWAMAATGLVIACEPTRAERFQTALVLFAVWIALETVWLLFSGGAVQFVAAFGSDYLGIGSVLSFGAIVLFAFVLTGQRPWWQIVPAISLCIGFVGLMLPVGGRGPILATAAAFATGIGISVCRLRGTLRVSRRGKLLVVLGIASAAVIVARMIEAGQYALAAERFLVLFESGMGESAGVRWYYYNSTLDIIAAHPYVGVGLGAWPIVMGLGFVRDYPHNLFLEVLAEQGLVGGLLLCAVLVYSTWLVLRRNGALGSTAGLTAALLAISAFVSAMVSGDLADNRVLFCMLGLCAASSRVLPSGSASTATTRSEGASC